MIPYSIVKCGRCGRICLGENRRGVTSVGCLCGAVVRFVPVKVDRRHYLVEVQVFPSRGRGRGRAPESTLPTAGQSARGEIPREGSVGCGVTACVGSSVASTDQKQAKVRRQGGKAGWGRFWWSWEGSRKNT